MKKVSILLILILTMIACSKPKTRSMFDIRLESLKDSIRIDTLFGNLHFGMTEREVYGDGLEYYADGVYYFISTPEISTIPFFVKPKYFNDSLYSIEFSSYKYGYKLDDAVKIYTLKYGNPDTIVVDEDKHATMYDAYWFNGNLEINVHRLKTSYTDVLRIEYEDISKDIFDISLINLDNYEKVFTKQYYDSIYLPREKSKLDGI